MKHLNILSKERNKKMINLISEDLYDIFPPYITIKRDNEDENILEKSKWNLIQIKNIKNENKEKKFNIKYYKNGCLTCGKSNIWVKYHGYKHICLECRKYLKSENRNELKIFLDLNGNPLVYEEIKTYKINKTSNSNQIIDSDIHKDIKYKKIKNDNIYYYDLRCLCTLSDIDQLIIIPYD